MTKNQYCIDLAYSSNNVVSKNNITANNQYGHGSGVRLYISNHNIVSSNDITANNAGILLNSSSNNNVFGNNVTANSNDGIDLYYSSNNNTISGNNVTANNMCGVELNSSSSNDLSDNNVTANKAYGIFFSNFSSHNTLSENTVKANNYEGIWLTLSSDNNTLAGNTARNNYNGIYLDSCDNNTLVSNNVTANTDDGISLGSSSDNTLSGNSVANNWYNGIDLWSHSNNNTLASNKAVNNGDGIALFSSSDNTLSGNNISNNSEGIVFRSSAGLSPPSGNVLFGNSITANGVYGVDLDHSSGNRIFHNDFLNNRQQTYVSNSTNTWDDGYPAGGNYWSNYNGTDLYSGPYQNMTGSDGIGDTPFVIDTNNTDRYPLMNPWGSPIYIRADGTVYPCCAPIQRNGTLYSLTDNIQSITNAIIIEKSNVTLDGRGYTLRGSGVGYGFDLWGVDNVTIRNTSINGFLQGVSLVLSSNDYLLGNNITGNNEGVWMWLSSNDTLAGNNITGNDAYGVWLGSGSSNNISWNNVENNAGGMLLSSSSCSNTITGNNVTANVFYGIVLNDCSNNTLTGNVLMDSTQYGVYLFSSSNRNTMTGNKIEKNACGIGLSNSLNNAIYHNNFIRNTHQVSSSGSPNTWDNGYPSGGNYWSDYNGTDLYSGPYQNITGSDGIGDKPYIIDANNTDRYPLMGTFNTYRVLIALELHEFGDVTVISNSTITGFHPVISIETLKVASLSFNVTGKQGSTGFGRVSIPKAMMNGTFAVFVNGTEIPYTLLPCSNANVSYLYFTYTHSTEQVIIVPEFPPLLILPLFMIIVLLGAIAFKRKRNAKSHAEAEPSKGMHHGNSCYT
jgi:parallel beta-helix repeat protein